jgi:hypothetical protein
MTETVWLTAVRAWNMPVSRLLADAATRLGLTERPNDWCQVRPCNAGGWVPRQDRKRVGDCPSGVSNREEASGAELPQAGRGDRHQRLGDLNLLVSETARQSRITSAAAAKLG